MIRNRLLSLGLAACALAALAVAPVVGAHVAHAAEVAAAVAPTAAPAAAAPLVVAEVSWWQTLWAQIQAPLIGLVTAVFTAVGGILAVTLPKLIGNTGSRAVNAVYQLVADQAAGWLIAQMHAVAEPVVNAGPGSTAVHTGDVAVGKTAAINSLDSAITYATKSYPDVLSKLGVTKAELGKDIVAAAGKLIAGGKASPGIASAIGGLLAQIGHR